MDKVLVAYWICFLVGTIYAAISALLGGFMDITHAGGLEGGGHFDTGQDYASGGHGEVMSGDAAGEPVIAPLSPATIAVFLATFGGSGIILTTMYSFPVGKSLPISVVAGLGVASAVFWVFFKIFSSVQASSEPRMAETIGCQAEVTVGIPQDNTGEVAFVCRGKRLVSPARSADGTEIPKNRLVKIARLVGNTLYVVPLTAEELLAVPEREEDAHHYRDA